MINKLYLLLKKIFKAEHLRVYWEDQVDDFNRFNEVVEKGGIVLLGDSITDKFRIGEFYHDKRIYNRGISGDTSAGVLKRMKESIYDLSPSKVFLLIGTNDISRPKYNEDQTAQNIAKVVIGINEQCPDVLVYVESVYPVNKTIENNSVYERTNQLIESLNSKIKIEIQDLKAKYIDMNPLLKDNEGNLKSEYTHDGLHLNGAGYSKVVEIIKPYLEE